MAQELVDGEFWLPSEFLTDDDILIDMDRSSISTVTDEDATSSPKSTLFGCLGSNLSTPSVPFNNKDDNATLDLLNKAASEVSKMRITTTTNIGTGFFDCTKTGNNTSNGQLYPPIITNPSQFPLPFPLPFPPLFYSQPPVKRSYNNNNNNNNNRPVGLPTTAWQAQPTIGTFIGPKKESVGTGVFLPRPISDSKKKSGENAANKKNNKGSQQRDPHAELPSEWVY